MDDSYAAVLQRRDFFEVLATNARQAAADYVSSGSFALETRDDDDHTFHGIVADVELTDRVPIEWLDVTGVSVRGALGAVKVLTAPGGFGPDPEARDRLSMRKYFSPLKPPEEWTLRFTGECEPARDEPRSLAFAEAARLAPKAPKNHAGPPPPTKLGVYVHSEHSDGVVYNNQRHRGVTLEDAHLRVLSGVAHTGGAPFARVGYWGDVAWRPRREFVGRVAYRVRLLLWTPEHHKRFPAPFQEMANALMLSRAALLLRGGQTKIGLGHLPLEALYYVLSFARHDWAGAAPPPPPPAEHDDERWEVRRDAYGSRVLVPRSQCAEEDSEDDDYYDEDDEDDFEDDGGEYEDEDDDDQHERYFTVETDDSSDDFDAVEMHVQDRAAPSGEDDVDPDAPPPPPPDA